MDPRDLGFEEWLGEQVSAQCEHMDPKGVLTLRLLQRELMSKRPAVRLQACRMLAEILGVFARDKEGRLRTPKGAISKPAKDLEKFLERMSEGTES